MKEFSRARSD